MAMQKAIQQRVLSKQEIGPAGSVEQVIGSADCKRPTTSKRRWALTFALPAVGLVVLAAALRFGIGPLVERVPDDYRSHVVYDTDGHFRDSLSTAWSSFKQIGRRTDQVLNSADGVAVVQSSADWSDLSGQVIYQISGRFGVDSETRRNVQGFGDRDRDGQFLFPSHVKPQTYEIRDITYTGSQVAKFERFEEIDDMALMVFQFEAAPNDDTASFEYMADVPERFKAFSDGRGTYRVEPVSGLIVDTEDTGRSYFVDPTSGHEAGDVNIWHNRYTPDTRAALLHRAKQWRMKILATEIWLPGALVGFALLWLTMGVVTLRRASARPARATANR